MISEFSLMNNDELYAVIGEEVSTDILPVPIEEYINRGKMWFADSKGKAQDLICSDPSIEEHLSSGGKKYSRTELLAVISDLILGITGNIPVTVVGLLIIREGLVAFCKVQ